MSKDCVIFFNCHGEEILKYLNSSGKFKSVYKCHYISLYDYLPSYKYSKLDDLIPRHKKLITNCDLIILQYMRLNRNIIHHDNILNLIKNDCKHILIQHYTFSGYYFPIPENIFNRGNMFHAAAKIWNSGK